ncbi:MAG: MerR family transcriptional regulator [Aquabacterium sp.]|uniref:MerR family transcriptional regulator n=1 Tax=Aquabacterium sp. TaxID=1872578 RepID=UPI0011F9B379|nr:MerR family transcriptional regulator [Aquabacterium sp.]TAK96167.1 MAG: MerR family transcriptional regulator [Aquabacterium sp.]
MKIGELAKRTGLPASTIRFYESKGLLNGVARQANGYRAYPPEAVALLSIITNAQQTGFSLDEIKQALPQDITDWQHGPLIELLTKKVEDIEAMERRLAHNKGLLITLINLIQGKPQDMDCRDNARRVMAQMGLSTGAPKTVKARKA